MFELVVLGASLLVLVATALAVRALKPEPSEQLLLGLRCTFVATWVFGMLFVAFVWIDERDWVHSVWAAAISLTALLFLAGPFLFAWASPSSTQKSSGRIESYRLAHGWSFAAMALALGVLPLVLVTVAPALSGRNVGEAPRRVFELVLWGLGGALPEALTPTTAQELARGVGHLPREVSLPVSALMQASWVIVIGCVFAIAGRCLPDARARRALLLFAPGAAGALVFVLAAVAHGNAPSLIDARLFLPLGNEDSGVWTSDPATLRSFGPVLLAALLAALVIPPIVALRPLRARADQRVGDVEPPADAVERAPSRG